MSEWLVRFGPLGLHRDGSYRIVVDMGSDTFRTWRRMAGRLYWCCPVCGRSRHMGLYWEHPAVCAVLQENQRPG